LLCTDDSRSEAETDNTESVVIKVEPDINFEEEEDDDDGNLLLDPPLQDDWDNQEKGKLSYRVFHGFGQAKFAYGGSILGSSQFTLLLQLRSL